jgi:Na+/glutamate symporter
MSHLISIYLKLIILSIIGMAVVKIWAIFIVVWMHGGKYQWTWMDAKSILVNGLVLAAVFCAIATITIYREKNRS